MDVAVDRHRQVQDYYGKVLTESGDLQTNACCTTAEMPRHIKDTLAQVHDEVLIKYYGCGLTIPTELDGCKVLDLGSGSGRDVYLVSKLVGEHGEVVGVDMTDEQLAVANAHVDYHAEQFGYAKPNTRFIKGNIERLDLLDLPDDYFDVIISNCVINLATDKRAVLEQALRVLKPGGEMYFSDVYADRRIAQHLVDDPVLYGECLSGALYWNDFQNLAKSVGFGDPRVVDSEPLEVTNAEVARKIAGINFYSATYRLFKIAELEPACEDYGQAVIYKGTVEHAEHAFDLDDHHHFPAGKIMPVCGNSYRMIADTRFAKHFELLGNWDTHYGIFEGCGTDLPYTTGVTNAPADAAAACC